MTVKIFCASELSANSKMNLESKLKSNVSFSGGFQFSFENCNFHYLVDSSLITGFYVQCGDLEFHYDLKNQLENIITELVN